MEKKLICFKCGQVVDENSAQCSCGTKIEEIVSAAKQAPLNNQAYSSNGHQSRIVNSNTAAPVADVSYAKYSPAQDTDLLKELIGRVDMLQKQQSIMAANMEKQLKKHAKKRSLTIAIMGVLLGVMLIVSTVCVFVTIFATSDTFRKLDNTIDDVSEMVEEVSPHIEEISEAADELAPRLQDIVDNIDFLLYGVRR